MSMNRIRDDEKSSFETQIGDVPPMWGWRLQGSEHVKL